MDLNMINTEVMAEQHKDLLRDADRYRLAMIAQSADDSYTVQRTGIGMLASFTRWIKRVSPISIQNSRLPRRQAHS